MKKLITLIILIIASLHLIGQDNIFRGTGHPGINKNFNLLVHIPVDSASRVPIVSSRFIDSLLVDTQKYFDPIGVTFGMCEKNIIENYTFGNLRDSLRIDEMKILYGKPHRINVYYVKDIPFAYCGSSSFNGIATSDDAHIFIEQSCSDGLALQLAHHFGHLFGLEDTYGDSKELVNGDDCATDGDNICDTPADPFLNNILLPVRDEQNDFSQRLDDILDNCEYTGAARDSNGDLYKPDVTNIMSAYPCKCKFTDNQLRKIVENYNQSLIKQF